MATSSWETIESNAQHEEEQSMAQLVVDNVNTTTATAVYTLCWAFPWPVVRQHEGSRYAKMMSFNIKLINYREWTVRLCDISVLS